MYCSEAFPYKLSFYVNHVSLILQSDRKNIVQSTSCCKLKFTVLVKLIKFMNQQQFRISNYYLLKMSKETKSEQEAFIGQSYQEYIYNTFIDIDAIEYDISLESKAKSCPVAQWKNCPLVFICCYTSYNVLGINQSIDN